MDSVVPPLDGLNDTVADLLMIHVGDNVSSSGYDKPLLSSADAGIEEIVPLVDSS
jgi:hypothetical protein